MASSARSMSLMCMLFDDAEDQNGEVEAAIALGNEHLRTANISTQLARRRVGDTAAPTDGSIAVYLVAKPGSALDVIREMERLREKVAAYKSQDFQFDPAFDHCSDADDCVEKQFKAPNVTALVLGTLYLIHEFGCRSGGRAV